MTDSDEEEPTPELPHAPSYPLGLETAEERHRFDACWALATKLFGPERPDAIWYASRALYRSDLPT